MRVSNRLEVLPPVVGVVKELLDAFVLEFGLKTGLLLNGLFKQQLCSAQVRNHIKVESEDAEGALVGQAHWQHFSVDFNLVAVEQTSPVNVLSAKDNRLLVLSVLQNGNVHWLVQFQEHCSVKSDLFIVSDELKQESLVEHRVCGSWHHLRVETILQEGDSH